MTMTSTCFVTPASFSVRSSSPSLQKLAAPCQSVTRTTPTASLRLPGGNNPFGFGPGSSSGRGFGNFFGSGLGAGAGSGWGSKGNDRGGRNSSGSGGAADSSDSNIFTKIWAAYNSRLDRFPITTKAMTSLIGFFLGDLIAQKFLGDKDSDIDWKRVARMASFGFLLHGPTGHYFYSALDRLIVGATPLKVAAKVAIDQILWAPIFTALFFSYLGFSEGKSLDDVITKIKNDTWIGVSTSWKFWPLAHTINFAFVPTQQRLLYVNTLQVGYNVILSLIGNK